MIEILYEDNHIIAVNKRPSDIVQGDKTGDKPLSEKLKELIKQRDNKPGNVFMGVAHRLDRPVSGVVVFAKTSKALSRLNELFRNRKVEKTYWAIVRNKPKLEEYVVEHLLAKNSKLNKSYVTKDKNIGLPAKLSYKLISSSDNYFLLQVKPLTGRHHQIRVQLSAIGSTIKGDLKYGAPRSNKDASISLHARKIEFIHPVKQEPICIVAPTPEDNLWIELSKNLKE